jgi:hypothetical protein
MDWASRIKFFSLVAALLFCAMTDGQDRQGDRAARSQTNACITNSGEFIASPSCRVIRAIEDPATRQHWLLVSDPGRPAAPALLVRTPPYSSVPVERRSKSQISSLPVIHSGDRLVVSEKTAVSEGRFDATALSAAALGEVLTARLKLGGSVLHVLATAPGQATLVAGRSEGSE